MARMAAPGKMIRTVRTEKMAKTVEMVATEAIVIGDVEEMGVMEEIVINIMKKES